LDENHPRSGVPIPSKNTRKVAGEALAELREQLRERGLAVAIGTLWRFLKRRKITRKKRRRTPPNSAAAR